MSLSVVVLCFVYFHSSTCSAVLNCRMIYGVKYSLSLWDNAEIHDGRCDGRAFRETFAVFLQAIGGNTNCKMLTGEAAGITPVGIAAPPEVSLGFPLLLLCRGQSVSTY